MKVAGLTGGIASGKSTVANLFASCAAGVSALWGPLHGGANVKVIDMLESIHRGKQTAREYIEAAKDKSSGIRLMGFGHRIYKNFDPRATMLRASLWTSAACFKVGAQAYTSGPPSPSSWSMYIPTPAAYAVFQFLRGT